MITISIDVTRLDKARFKKVKRQNGEEATFCDLVLIDTPNNKHGDFIVKQDTTKEERERRVEMPILGNGKIRGGSKPQGEPASRPKPAPQRRPPPNPDLDSDDSPIPF